MLQPDCFRIHRLPHSLLLGLTMLIAVAGCGSGTNVATSSAVRTSQSVEIAEKKEDLLGRAIEFVLRLSEFEPQTVDKQINYYLSRWLDVHRRTKTDWQADPLIAEVPLQAKRLFSRKELLRRHMTSGDVRYLKECVWFRLVAKWAVEKAPTSTLVKLNQGLQGAAANQLEETRRIFQWTMRNIQLGPFPKVPKTILAGKRRVEWRSHRRIVGPGYGFHPWQVVMQGVGDAWQRSVVFMLLLRQRGIDSVMLAVDQTETGDPEHKHKLWIPGVLIRGKVYLFDTQLGLPVPGAKKNTIATWTELQANPELLDTLRVGSTFPYTVTAPELKKVVALLHAAPAAVSRRWKKVEDRLTGKNKIVLTHSPSSMKDRLNKVAGIRSVRFWRVPIETIIYRRHIEKELKERPDSAFSRAYRDRYGIFERYGPFVRARYMHMKAEFDKTETRKQSATSIYLDTRVPDVESRRLYSDLRVQRKLGIVRSPKMNNRQWKAIVTAALTRITLQKMHASYWIGLIHFENGRFDVAEQWLTRRLLDKYKKNEKGGDPLFWRAGATYSLGRALEAMGKIKEARQVYLADDSLGRHGSLVRARMLTDQVK